MLLIYKTSHPNGRSYIGRHETNDPNDGYLGSGVWVKSIKDKNLLTREVLSEATSIEELCHLEEYYIKLHFDNPLCMNVKLASIGMTSTDVTGEKHPCYDHNKYHFIHSDNREFVGTKYEFREQFNINSGQLAQLLNGTVLSAKGWRIFGTEGSKVLTRQRKIYHFIHSTGDEYIGTRGNFLKKYPEIKRQYIDLLVSGKGKSAKGWKIIKKEEL